MAMEIEGQERLHVLSARENPAADFAKDICSYTGRSISSTDLLVHLIITVVWNSWDHARSNRQLNAHGNHVLGPASAAGPRSKPSVLLLVSS